MNNMDLVFDDPNSGYCIEDNTNNNKVEELPRPTWIQSPNLLYQYLESKKAMECADKCSFCNSAVFKYLDLSQNPIPHCLSQCLNRCTTQSCGKQLKFSVKP